MESDVKVWEKLIYMICLCRRLIIEWDKFWNCKDDGFYYALKSIVYLLKRRKNSSQSIKLILIIFHDELGCCSINTHMKLDWL